jgi:hypothetical protein
MWWKGVNSISNKVTAYLRTCKLLYNQCLEERMRFEREHEHDGQKHKFSRKSVSQRARLIYQREKKTTVAGHDSNNKTGQ